MKLSEYNFNEYCMCVMPTFNASNTHTYKHTYIHKQPMRDHGGRTLISSIAGIYYK